MSNVSSLDAKLTHFETSYLEYLTAVHYTLHRCVQSCQCWSAPYDGENPSPDSLLVSPTDQKQMNSVDSSPTAAVVNSVVVNGEVPVVVNGEVKRDKDSPSMAVDQHPNMQPAVLLSDESKSSEVTSSNDATPTSDKVSSGDGSTVAVKLKAGSKMNSAESVTSDTDSGLSASSLTTNQSVLSEPSNSDSPPNDRCESGDFSAFLLTLKRVDTPVEFCDNMEDSFIEMDSLISELGSSMLSVDSKPSTAPLAAVSTAVSTPPDDVNKPVSHLSASSPTSPTSPTTPTAAKPAAASSTVVPPKVLGPPNIGPFLQTLLTKLESMMSNTLYVNLLLTGMLARLACYPQPLLRSFLLNPGLVFQPTVKSLMQVLGSVKHRVDCHSYTIKEFDVFLLEARRFLAWRQEMHITSLATGRGRSASTVSLPAHLLSGKPGIEQAKEKKKGGFSEFLFGRNRLTVKPVQPRLRIVDGKSMHYVNRTSTPQPADKPNNLELIRTKNAVYCAVILEEFLKELAAISQEHGVLDGY